MFWMLVRDAGQGRSYTQLLNNYRAHPEALVRELPHHDPDRVIALAGNLNLILWRDMVRQVVQVMPTDDPEVTSIKNELRLRISQ